MCPTISASHHTDSTQLQHVVCAPVWWLSYSRACKPDAEHWNRRATPSVAASHTLSCWQEEGGGQCWNSICRIRKSRMKAFTCFNNIKKSIKECIYFFLNAAVLSRTMWVKAEYRIRTGIGSDRIRDFPNWTYVWTYGDARCCAATLVLFWKSEHKVRNKSN